MHPLKMHTVSEKGGKTLCGDRTQLYEQISSDNVRSEHKR